MESKGNVIDSAPVPASLSKTQGNLGSTHALEAVLGNHAANLIQATPSPNRRSFADDFIFGIASSAYQFEGAANEGGRGPSIWDTFTQRHPGKMKDGGNGYLAVDSYHQYKEDVAILKKIGLDAYRFSISWPRVLPRGNLSGGVNKEGVKYYNNLIDELLASGIEPFVTLFHWDLPQALEDEYGGFLSSEIVKDFCDFAELCFWEFGDRVKHWITLNEPWSYSCGGYVTGTLAPGRGSSSPEHIEAAFKAGRCSSWHKKVCTDGDPGTEPYIVTHNQLLAHAMAVELYRQKYQACQKGKIGITLVSTWMVPYSKKDCDAAQRALDFTLGWFMDPLTNGDYSKSMKSRVKERLPKFSNAQSKLLIGSFDFLGLNYYTANYVANDSSKPKSGNLSYTTDSQIKLSTERDGVPIGPKAASDWLYVYPRGIYDLLVYINKNYNDPLIYITENGVDEENNAALTLSEARINDMRIEYHRDHLSFLRQAIEDGVNVKGYFAWSFLDNFEWSEAYNVRFGMIHVDYKNGLARYPKDSAIWFMNFLNKEK